jgi:hypothetical protein
MRNGPAGGATPSKKGYDTEGKKIKVSQSTIDDIKRLGMTKALKMAGRNKDAYQAGEVAAFAEGVRRMYGDTRYQNALYTPKASPGPASANYTGRYAADKAKTKKYIPNV